ncbi:MAG: hypothetical protein QNJ87_04310 [Gammaproteobacteria bacterium]|nr:hypothetical protein [Gammaproteobacteria bacterium]MDJ0891370.1 hypothetical protein [Gammaproteobacteria bacterium]
MGREDWRLAETSAVSLAFVICRKKPPADLQADLSPLQPVESVTQQPGFGQLFQGKPMDPELRILSALGKAGPLLQSSDGSETMCGNCEEVDHR